MATVTELHGSCTRRTQAAAPEAFITLLAASEAKDYYARVGLERGESAWILWPGHRVS